MKIQVADMRVEACRMCGPSNGDKNGVLRNFSQRARASDKSIGGTFQLLTVFEKYNRCIIIGLY